jgi:hypothetical protein
LYSVVALFALPCLALGTKIESSVALFDLDNDYPEETSETFKTYSFAKKL